MKNILHLGAGKLMINNVKILKKAGYNVFLVDKDPLAPAFNYGDGYKSIDIIDFEELSLYAREINANAIMAVNDAGVLSAALVSEKLGLNHFSVETANRATDKGLMRESWKIDSLSQPNYLICSSKVEIEAAINKIKMPCVLKPCLNWGSKGVSVISSKDDIKWAIDFAYSNNRNDRFIIEEYIQGLEVTIEGLVLNDEISILAYSDKEHQSHPRYRVAMSLNYPAAISKNVLLKLDDLIKKAVKAIKIKNSAFHAECIIQNENVYLIEMAARPGGGHIFGCIVEATSGINMPLALAKILLGEKVQIQPLSNNGACYKFFNAPKGVFKKLENFEIARKTTGVLDMGFDLKRDTLVNEISGDADRPGYIVTSGIDREEAIRISREAFMKLKFITE